MAVTLGPWRASFRPGSGRFVLPWIGCLVYFLTCFSAGDAMAGWESKFSLTTAEEYNDNIFFSNEPGQKNQSDFITQLVPTFSFLYTIPGQESPSFITHLSPSGQLFAKHSELNNFGDNISADAAWTYNYSRRFTLRLDEAFFRGGGTRTGLSALGQESQPTTPTSFPPTNAPPTLPIAQDLAGSVSKGKVLSNSLSVQGAYLTTPTITVFGRYGLTYTNFAESAGADIANTVGFRGVYGGFRGHQLHAGYSITFLNSSSTAKHASNIIHSFDLGDDYASAFKIELTPTLTLSGTSGFALATGKGFGVVNNSTATLIKFWKTAVFNAGVRTGLGSSFGLSSGVAQSRQFFSNYGIRLTKEMTASVGVEYTKINTADVDVGIFRASGSVQYWITSWLSSTLWYGHRWRNSDDSTDLVTKGRVQGNSVVLALTSHFNLWPRVGLSKAPIESIMFQTGAPPFPAPGESSAPQPAAPQTPGSP